MNKGDAVKRKAFKDRYEIVADRNNPKTEFNGPFGKVELAKGYDFLIVNIDDDWPENKIRPFENVMEFEIEPIE
jgi:hypothetical protein